MQTLTSTSGQPVSDLCFGTMQFGGGSDEIESATCFEACRAAGVNFFDCAWVYNGGASETILGQLAVKDREDLILATKGGYTGGAGRKNLNTQIRDSLRRLQTDYIDVYFLHRFDPETPLEETFETLGTYVSKGILRTIGVSNYAAWQVMKAQRVAENFGFRIDVIQPMYSLVKRQAEVELLPMCLSEGIAVTPYSPLGGGLLTGKYSDAASSGRLTHDKRYAARYAPEWMQQTATDLSALANRLNISPITLAVQWVHSNPAITAPIISGKTPEQLAPSLAAMESTLSENLYDEITALSPTPAPATDRLEEG